MGAVKRLIHHEGALFAEAEITSELIQRIKNGEFSGISVSFYPPSAENNPIREIGCYLKHVGFLEQGKQVPAVQGMLDPKVSVEYLAYNEINDDLILFCEEDSSLSYAEKTHKKAQYFTNILGVDYETALHIINQ